MQFETWVICYGEEQAVEIQRYLEKHGSIPGLHFEFVSHAACGKYSGHVHGRRWLAYRRWHREAFGTAQRLHKLHHFDLVHQVTNSGFREPGLLWKLDVPFVWGPLGGTHNSPWRFLLEAGLKHGVCEAIRNATNSFQLNWSRRGRAAARQASALLVSNSTAQEQIRRAHSVHPITMLDVGIERLAPPPTGRRRSDSDPLRVLWSGQLIPRKALSLLLKALAKLPPDVAFQLRVIGGGPLERYWKSLATRLGVADRVEWLGWLSHKDCLRQYDWSDVFAFTSLRDNSGTVLLEAMANGLPIVCLDHQGARDIVTDRCGLRVPVTRPRQVVDDLCLAITRLARDPDLRAVLGRAARDRADDYLWSRLGEQITHVYKQVLQTTNGEMIEGVTTTAGTSHSNPHVRKNSRRSIRSSVRREQEVVAFIPGPVTTRVTTFPRNQFRDAMTWAAQRAAVGLHAVLGDRPQKGFGILMYHRVADWTKGIASPTSNVTPRLLRTHLEGLLSRGFEAWPLRKLIEFRTASRQIPGNVFAVTFDDGYENNLLAAVPVLEDLRVPATIFVATAFLDSDRPFPFDNWSFAGSPLVPPSSWRPLSTKQCDELTTHSLIELGAHTHTHGAFGDKVDEFQQDLAKSVEILERRFGVVRPTFSFPFGVVNSEMIEAAKDAGVICGLTSRSECVLSGTNPFGWGRYSADDRDTVPTLAAKLNGWYTPVAHVLRAIKRPMAAITPQAIGELVESSKPCFAPHNVQNTSGLSTLQHRHVILRKGNEPGHDSHCNLEDEGSPRRRLLSLRSALHQRKRALLPLLSVLDQATVSGTSFATAVIVGRATSQDQLGVYYLVLTFTLGLIGLHEAVISGPYTIFGARRRGQELAEYGGSIWAHHWALTAVSMVALLIGTTILAWTSNADGFVLGMWALLAAAPALLLREAIRFFSYARLRVGTAVIVDATVSVLQLAGLLLLWYAELLTVPRVFIVIGFACLLGGLASLLFEPRTALFVRQRVVNDWNENWSFAKWTTFSFLVGNTIPLIMPWILNFAAGTAATGVFGACATLLGATNIIVLGVGNFLKPKAAIAYSSHGVAALRRLLFAVAAFFAVAFGAVCAAVWLTGDWAMVVVYGPSFEGTGTILAVLSANVLVGSLGLIVCIGLLAIGRSRMNFMSDICWSATTILAALLLVFPYGVVGAAVASLIGTIATTAMRTTSLYLAMRSLEPSCGSARAASAIVERHPFTPSVPSCHEALETVG